MKTAHSFLFLSVCVACTIGKADDLPRRPFFGASVSPDPSGVRVDFITIGSPAEQSGLRVGDVVQNFARSPIKATSDFLATVRGTPVGIPEPLQILRAGSSLILSITLVPAPKETAAKVQTFYGAVTVNATLRRTLTTVPLGVRGKLPAMLIIGGIGCYSVDNPNDPYDPYRFLAHDLARAGIVTMRLEKSGIGDSQGDRCFDTDYNAEAASYLAALQALRLDGYADPERLYLFGHSIGSLISPQLALGTPVAGIIIAEGVGRNWFEYELWNLRRQAELAGEPPEQVDVTLESKELCMHRLLIQHENEADIERDLPQCKSRNTYPVGNTYMEQVAAINVARPWTKITAPVLAIYGTGDFVTAEADHHRIVNIVNANRPGSAAFRAIPGMDHHLGSAGTPQEAYDLRVKNHRQTPYEPKLSLVVSQWICAHERCNTGVEQHLDRSVHP